jgi:exodeoxyribonuclease V alpha subunit
MVVPSLLEDVAVETITGRIRFVRFTIEGGWGVARLEDGTDVTGIIPAVVRTDIPYRFVGGWKESPKYGRQFAFASAAHEVPTTDEALVDYIAGSASGIGPVRARAILAAYGRSALDVLKADPARVASEISGVTLERAQDIQRELLDAARDEAIVLPLMSWLGGYSTTWIVTQIVAMFGDAAMQRVAENPYCLTEIRGIGFRKADAIALAHKIAPDSRDRIVAAVEFAISESESDGHTCITEDGLVTAVQNLTALGSSHRERIAQCILVAKTATKQHGAVTHVYSRRTLAAEDNAIARLRALVNAEPITQDSPAFRPQDLAEDQMVAFELIRHSNVAILTGAPGTGKTYTVRQVIGAFAHHPIALAAPTGKAAKRLSALTGSRAVTVHKLLRSCMIRGRFQFTRGRGTCPACLGSGERDEIGTTTGPRPCPFCSGTGEKQPLDEQVIVIDEVSMMDLHLLSALLDAIADGSRLLLVGDHYQLPSVGPGNVLKDLLRSLPSFELCEIKRQAEGSAIIRACHAIKEGVAPRFVPDSTADLTFKHESSPEKIAQLIAHYATSALGASGRFGSYDPLRDCQVITALRTQSDLSVEALNKGLQLAYGRKPVIGNRWSIGDKVIQLRNTEVSGLPPNVAIPQDARTMTADLNEDEREQAVCGPHLVVNGDFGYIVGQFDEKHLIVEFESPYRLCRIPIRGEDCNIDLAYACTVHKFQGSEARVIILPVHSCLGIMVPQRNWLYTAVSRARELCVVIGEPAAWSRAVDRTEQTKRRSLLGDRLLSS